MRISWRSFAIALACMGALAAGWLTRTSERSSAEPASIEMASSTNALAAPAALPPDVRKPIPSPREPRRAPASDPLEIRGFVLDASGLPKARAELKSYPDGQPLVSTDDSGEFLLVLRGTSLTVVGTDGALSSPPIIVTANDARRSVMVRLREPTELKIRVVEATTRRPIHSADVVVQRDGEFMAQTLTDAAGAASISIPAGGAVSLTGTARGHAKVSRRVSMSAGSGGVHSVTLALPPGVRLEGNVVQDNGSPAAGAEVTAWDATHLSVGAATADPSGRFSLDGLYPGTFDVRALAEGAGSATLESVQLSEPVQTVSLRLVRGLSVFGEVVGADRRPVPEASVYLSPSAGFGVQQRRTVTSDANGRFEFVAVADADVAVWATLGNRASETVSARPQNAPLSLQLAERYAGGSGRGARRPRDVG
jgi:carboxypeptidase family protein